MKIEERCGCGASVVAEDQVSGAMRYKDGSGTGYAADFVERWRAAHRHSEAPSQARAAQHQEEAG